MWKTLPTIVALTLSTFLLAQEAATLKLGQELTQLFYAGELDAVWDRLSPEMRGVFGTIDKLQAFRGQVEAQLGPEASVASEDVVAHDGVNTYVRTAKFEKVAVPIIVQWALDSQGVVVGFLIGPARTEAPSQYLEYRTKTALRLPFQGEWFVFWGGRKVDQNYHASTRDQRFAYDLLIMRDESTHTGDGKRNEDYYCFGMPILAPAAGVVHEAVDGIDDNVPGEMNAAQPVGNHVVLDHGNGEFSFLAHFRKGSVKVKEGDRVEAGQQLGLCGNSGNSSEPHLHYHLQNSGEFGKGDGLPAPFVHYLADGQPVDRGEPVKGQHIRPAPR